jgi:preprotein translocase subunit SecG
MEELQKEERPLEFTYRKEDAKLLRDDKFTIIASVLFIVMAIAVGVLITKRIEQRDKSAVERINSRTPSLISPVTDR